MEGFSGNQLHGDSMPQVFLGDRFIGGGTECRDLLASALESVGSAPEWSGADSGGWVREGEVADDATIEQQAAKAEAEAEAEAEEQAAIEALEQAVELSRVAEEEREQLAMEKAAWEKEREQQQEVWRKRVNLHSILGKW